MIQNAFLKYILTKMAHFILIKLIRKVAQLKELQDGFIIMAYMMDFVSKEKNKDLEDLYLMMANFIKDTGLMTNKKGREQNFS